MPAQEAGRTSQIFWANPWIFVLYGFCLALPLIVFLVRAARGDFSPFWPLIYAVGSALLLAWMTVVSGLRLAEKGILVPEPFWTFGNMWHPPKFVPWMSVRDSRIAKNGVILETEGGHDILLEGYHRANLHKALQAELARRRPPIARPAETPAGRA
ncbi:MAG: hypothetical protein ACYDDF_10960 [Thermoplasmatota archaeon]